MSKIPNHIAVIPDGNRRWAKARLLNPWEGHIEGLKRFWEIADYAYEQGVKHITFWGSSYGNLSNRSKIEVAFLMKLLNEEVFSPRIQKRMTETKTRFQLMGEWREFVKDKNVVKRIEDVISESAKYKERAVTILFGYDGQREMLAATNTLVKAGKHVNEASLRKALWTSDLPDVDLVIRTGGEPHWSAGFMMWQTANSQFYFTDILWPDFKKQEFKKALVEYERRERRLGK